jgi:hypothetical protein
MIRIYCSFFYRMAAAHIMYAVNRNKGAFDLKKALITVVKNERKIRYQGWYDEPQQ